MRSSQEHTLSGLPRVPAFAAKLWAAGAAARARLYMSGVLRQKRLQSKVISVGNLAWGGTGKTPFTIWLAARLQNAGLTVSILTRGYARTSPERMKILHCDAPASSAAGDGDEVQLYLRHLTGVPIGIGARRRETGRILEQEYSVDVHLLDDGFQHLQLARDVDFVLLDASDPWGQRGRSVSLLREPPRSLRRAGVVILSNADALDGPGANKAAESGAGLRPLLQNIQQWSGGAPIFLARTRPLKFEGCRIACCGIGEMRERRPLAFAGLGNPAQFFAMLRREGIAQAAERAYPDHHRYSAEELARLETLARREGADCLLGTEKDLVNLPGEPFSLLPTGLPIYWAATELVVEDSTALLEWTMQKLGLAARERSRPSRGTYAENTAS